MGKIADDLLIGGDTIDDTLHNWRYTLSVLAECDLHLSAKKTIIAPVSATMLGWLWQAGTLRALLQRLAILSTCVIPQSVCALRVYLGVYQILAHVIPNCASFLSPLDHMAAGGDSKSSVAWTDPSSAAFRASHEHLHSTEPSPFRVATINYGWPLTPPFCAGALALPYTSTEAAICTWLASSPPKLKLYQSTWLRCELD